MKVIAILLGIGVLTMALALPAVALEDGILETSSSTPNEDSTHAEFEHVLTNTTDAAIAVAPRDLRSADYPILTLVAITAGTFEGGIWTVGTLEAGQTASITYTGDAASDSSTATTTAAPETTTTVIDTTTTAAPATTTAPEELPYTGGNEGLAVFAIVGLALIGLGAGLLRTSRG